APAGAAHGVRGGALPEPRTLLVARHGDDHDPRRPVHAALRGFLSACGGEPRRVGEAVAAMGLRHTVITSVARDDLADGGSTIFARVVEEIRRRSGTVIEVLGPAFRGHADDLRRVIDAGPEVINHNIEAVERLHPLVRPSARYERSLELLRRGGGGGGGVKGEAGGLWALRA